MKSPRFLAALAMAAVLTTGTTAHAAFNQVGGNNVTGQVPMQEAEVFHGTNPALEAQGDISLDGTFRKRINTFPTPATDGHYLRITMPIRMDYNYDVDQNTMQSTDMVITNDSVHATQTGQSGQKPNLDYKRVRMTIVDFEKNDKGITTMAPDVKFVEDAVTEATKDDKNVLLPFELQVITGRGPANVHSIKEIQEAAQASGNNNAGKTIDISAQSAITLKLEQINGQTIGNKDLIQKDVSKTSHNLKLKFEYLKN